MFFSVFNYYTKTNKRTALEFSETKNYVKKTSMLPVTLRENVKNKLIREVVGFVSSVSLCEN